MRSSVALLIACLFAAACTSSEDAPSVSMDAGAGGSTSYSRCSNDEKCTPGACVGGICVPRASTFATPLAVEISPAAIGPQAALTEKIGISTSGDWTRLGTSASSAVTMVFDVPARAAFPSTASLLLQVPSLIPGRPALTLETTIVPGSTAVAIMVPAMLGGRPGTLAVIPLPPADQTSPPYQFAVSDALDPAVLTLPTDNQTPHGALFDALNAPKTAYTARAFLDGTLVSNVATMKADGTFGLFIPTAVTGDLSVELAPAASSEPWFTFSPLTLSAPNENLGTVTLPAYQVPQNDPPVTFMVRGTGNGAPVAGAALRAITILAPDAATTTPPGVTRFWQSTTTAANGNASVALIPGVNRTPRLYDVTVVPPPGSPYASTCIPRQPILGGGDTPTIVVPLRPVLSGTVYSAQAVPVSATTVTASRKPDLAKVCSATGPIAFTTTTDKSGAYTLPVDPGSYQLDFEPTSGSSAPRLSEYNVVVNASVIHLVQLPQPFLMEGDVVDSVQMPLPNATIRIFEPLCPKTDGCTLPPILRAETQSDDVGHFRAIVALPSGN